MPEPQQAGRRAAAGRGEVRADLVTTECTRGVPRSGDDGRDTGRGGDHRGLDLGGHASGAQAPGARLAELDAVQVLPAVHPVDLDGIVPARVTVVEAVDIGKEDERVRPCHVRDESGEPVIVAEPDLVGGNRVVLVDHGQHAEF